MFNQLRFTDDEYQHRLARIQREMSAQAMDALLLTDDRHTWYFSGFGDAHPMGSRARPRILLIPAAGDPVFIVHRSTEVAVREMIWFSDVRTYRDLTRGPTGEIVSVLQSWKCRKVGAELGREQRANISPNDLLILLKELPLADASSALWRVRTIKSAEEIGRIERACRMTATAYEKGFSRIRPGMTEHEVGGIFTGLMAEEGATGSWIWVVTSEYHRVDGVLRNRRVEKGDLIFIDMGANFNGYWADFSRTGILGDPTSQQQDTYRKIVEVCDIGVELLQPGNRFKEVAGTLHREMAARGLSFNSMADRYGHGLGMAVTEPPNVWDDEEAVIEPGLVLTMEPGMHRKDGMFHIEQNVVIESAGNRVISTAPKGMVVI